MRYGTMLWTALLLGACLANGTMSADEPAKAPPRAYFLAPVAVGDDEQLPKPRPVAPPEQSSGDKTYVGPRPAILSATILSAGDEQMIDFLASLRLAETQNPDIGLARQAIQAALAEQLQARAMALPSVNAGANFREHQGVLQTSSGKMIDADFSSLYVGNGAMATAAGTTVVPGIQIYGHVGDAIFMPLAARQLVAARNFQAEAASHQILLEVSTRFLDLLAAEEEWQALRLSEKDMGEAVFITRAFAKAQQGRDADYKRAEAAAFLVHAQTLRAEESILTASAELARVLSLDPAVRLRAAGPPGAMLELVDAGQRLETLLDVAFANRPELAALAADIARRRIQVRQEMTRPLFPTISLGFSAGGFGGGPTGSFSHLSNRTDADLVAYWTLQNMGLGNRALQKGRVSEQDQAVLEKERMTDSIGREVTTARALVLARRGDVEIARARVRVAENAFAEDLKRIRGNVGLPIELLNSLDRLVAARVGVVRRTQEYNTAQIQLFVAIGQTPLAVSARP